MKKIEKYKEKVNRERIILPELQPISFFKNIIDESIDFIIKPINNADTIQQFIMFCDTFSKVSKKIEI